MAPVEKREGRATLLTLQKLGVSLDELAIMTGADIDMLANCLLNLEPAPRWLNLLAELWRDYPGSLDQSRENFRDLWRNGGSKTVN